jgi:hypothetical protein
MPLDANSLVASHEHLNEQCFDHIYEIYYGTDDGFDELRPREEARHDAAHVARLYEIFARFEDFHARVAPEPRADPFRQRGGRPVRPEPHSAVPPAGDHLL